MSTVITQRVVWLMFMSLILNISLAQINDFVNLPQSALFESVSPGGWAKFNPLDHAPEQVFEQQSEAFGIAWPYSMELATTIQDQRGQDHFRFKQYWQDIPIYGPYYVIHTNKDGGHTGNGKIVLPETVEADWTLQEEQALALAVEYIGADSYYWEDEAREARIKLKNNNADATYFPQGEFEFLLTEDWNQMRLCYTFHIYTEEFGKSGKYYVDAISGEIVKILRADHNCVTGDFVSNWYGPRNVFTYDNGDEFELEDDCFDSDYGVYDEFNDGDIFTDPDNDWEAFDERSAATSLWGIKRAFHAYRGTFGWDGHDGDYGNLDIYQGYDFGEDGQNNASYSYDPIGDDEIKVGIGDALTGVMDDWNPLDIMGHEFTHGVDEYTAELEYEGESGALDESFADIFGEWIEFYEFGTMDWFVGGDRVDSGCPQPIRYFPDPNADDVPVGNNCQRDFDQPNTYLGANWYQIPGCDPDGDTDNCGVHTNSGVQNQMFFLLVIGDSGWNNGQTCHANPGNGYPWEVDGIGINDAIAIAWYVHAFLLGPTSDYQDARDAWVAAASTLFGECSFEAVQTGKAWYAVGFDPPPVSSLVLCNSYGLSDITITHESTISTDHLCDVDIVDGGGEVIFSAGVAVNLNPGFHAFNGSSFRANLNDCDFAAY